MPDGKSIVFATTAIPELIGKWEKADLAAMKKEFKRRKDSKMTAKVTENRQYRYFDKWLTDNNVHRLLRVDLETKALTDLTPTVDRLFLSSGEVHFDVSPDGKTVALQFNSTPAPFRDFLNADIYLIPTDGSGAMKNVTPENKGSDGGPDLRAGRPLGLLHAPGDAVLLRRIRQAVASRHRRGQERAGDGCARLRDRRCAGGAG